MKVLKVTGTAVPQRGMEIVDIHLRPMRRKQWDSAAGGGNGDQINLWRL